MAGIKSIIDAAELITDVRAVFSKIEELRDAQKSIVDVIEKQDKRLRELEASFRELKSETKFEAIKETQAIVNAVQGQLYNEIRTLSLNLDRLARSGKIDRNAHTTVDDTIGRT